MIGKDYVETLKVNIIKLSAEDLLDTFLELQFDFDVGRYDATSIHANEAHTIMRNEILRRMKGLVE